MSDYVSFDGTITPLEWGKSVYTVLPLPDEVTRALGKTRRVEGEIADHPVNLALTRAPVIAQTFLYTGKTLLREIGIAPGDTVEVRLRPAPETVVEVPEDLKRALLRAGLGTAWAALTPGKRRGHLHLITSARRAETRIRRIAALLSDLSG